jgi:transposase InsO family protein
MPPRYGRYGYRRILALLRGDGWVVNHKRMERIWRQDGATDGHTGTIMGPLEFTYSSVEYKFKSSEKVPFASTLQVLS